MTKVMKIGFDTKSRTLALQDQVEYLLELNDKKRELEEKIEAERTNIAGEMLNLNLKEVKSKTGRASFVERKTTTWTMESLIRILGPLRWKQYVKVDEKKVKAGMEILPKIVVGQLEEAANTTIKAVLDVR